MGVCMWRITPGAMSVALVLGASLLTAVPATAQPSARDRAIAESLFREAKKRFEAGEIADACNSFAESQRVDPRLGTLLHLATCHEKEGKLATAWIEFSEAEKLAVATKQKDRVQLARNKASELEPRLPKLVIVSKATGATISLDGQSLGEGSLGVPMPLDPGKHVVEATAPGKRPFSRDVTLEADSAPVSLEIDELESDAPPVVEQAPAPAPVAPPPSEAPGSGVRTAGYVLGGAGIVGIATGAYLGVLMLDRKSSAETGCIGRYCTHEALDRFDEAKTQGLLSTLFVGAGVAALATGITLVLTAPSSSSSSSAAALTVSPTAGGAPGFTLGGHL